MRTARFSGRPQYLELSQRQLLFRHPHNKVKPLALRMMLIVRQAFESELSRYLPS